MQQKRFIIIIGILGLILISIIVGYVFIRQQKNSINQPDISPSPSIENPTGIVIPTSMIKPNELDIVTVSPDDKKQNIDRNNPIKITFSQPFTMQEIEFYISPHTPASLNIEGNILVIRPSDVWDSGTEYTYSVNFPSDITKVRLYSFSTVGPTPAYLPDTAPEDYFQAELQKQKENRTDMYVANQTPYENTSFQISSEYITVAPAHFYFTVISKIADQERLKQEVNEWLQSLDLRPDQISKLDIRYQ
ncbi:MAG: hypothetical protein US54_C0021G0011 [Candidatus Roizmanbacteria bacterium GW2011_GWA2_37_7]|uniref:SbsA Ig-like domain-containing protein n=1 Tax=Candidatus Roizmanbacteria bacterium GW2011_GWA2_37_7 TaxID=1618481 RepID=A0A0G0JME5_9BACT|nr:MAG: hypothetical protein US54_C0021G0011 [Candidatus Roizmanbacteria bacterium GW2011_GWA2_37_7]